LMMGALLDRIPSRDSPEDRAIQRLNLQQFAATLTGRKRDVWNLIVERGYDRESCKNYIREIADILGVTPGNVNLRLRQIKAAWMAWVSQEKAREA
jgi:DNA-directed RNA polymerase specialized sigma24 family protein